VRGRGYRFALERTNTPETPEPAPQPTESNSTSST
jgi:hypothetical protein